LDLPDKIQRIKGPFTYFCPIAATYELPIIVVLLSGLVSLLKGGRLSRVVLIASSAVAVPLMILWHRSLPADPWDTRLHMTSTMHIVFAAYVLVLGLAATFAYLKRGRRFPAFLAYWLWTSLLLYSYAGEKVPWLLMHVLVPTVLWTALLLGEFFKSERFRRIPAVYAVLLLIGSSCCSRRRSASASSMRRTPWSAWCTPRLRGHQEVGADDRRPRRADRHGAQPAHRDPGGIHLAYTPGTLRDYKDWFHPGGFASPARRSSWWTGKAEGLRQCPRAEL
jgi:predicted membrane-bound mannosyltransferase